MSKLVICKMIKKAIDIGLFIAVIYEDGLT